MLTLLLLLSISQPEIKAYFSPNGGIRKAIISELKNAHKTVDIAMYMFTDRRLAYQVVALKNNGIRVRIVLDGPASENRFSKSRFLKKNGVNINE